ncbi:L-lactate dehydrogenase [Laspinema palackyanum]|uniref:L-lactate dehydrogenase n=1 Tax=Laspinema palackyanum TaxID=3231601 RepID=UPI00345D1D77|nr:L-lactate dehydrogenase [Laspinema sp. D2c]
MFEQLFTEFTDRDRTVQSNRRPLKGVIIGAGQVGMACAYSMLIQNTLDEMLLVDVNQEKLQGEVMDLLHGVPFLDPTGIRSGTLAESDDPDIVIITAGAKQQPGETRLDLLNRNVQIFKKLIPDIVQYCPHAILLLVTNPVDIMTYVTLKLSGFPCNRVFGSGTVLDTARFRYLLANQLQIDPRSFHAYIIGEHGDSEVPVWSKVNIAGMNLCSGGIEDCSEANQERLQGIFDQVKNAAYEVIKRKGATSYAIGLGVTDIVKAVLRNQNRVLTVSSFIHGVNGINDVCLSLPAVVNREGVTRVLDLSLTPNEENLLQQSATVLKEAIAKLDL